MNTLDIGLGMGHPSLTFSQYYWDQRGIHLGIKLDQGLYNMACFNLKSLIEKGLVNYFYECFTDESIKLLGEPEHIIPPYVAFVHDEISDIVDIGWADLCYRFDAVNSPMVNGHMAKE